MKYLYCILFCLIQCSVFSQFYIGTLSENYQLHYEKMDKPFVSPRNNPSNFTQLDGFPLSFPRDPNTPNLRNVTLEDINNDGVQEILFSASNILYAYANNKPLWEREMIGTGIYPPSVADIDNDGDMEIIQVTGGNGRDGRVYAVDHLGNNLPGFPKNYDDNWIITTAVLSDLDNDGQMEIIFAERDPPNGNIHILDNKGEIWNDNWPIQIPGTPAITPSIGDIDNDGKKEVIVASTTVLYAFDLDGQLKEGWPVNNPDTRFSFQSPILVDLDGDDDLEIVGAAHGNLPEFYVLNHDGSEYMAWPFFVPERTWSFVSPTVIEEADGYSILMSRPAVDGALSNDKIYKWNSEGNLSSDFPIENESGTHGVISVANVDDDEAMEIIISSNIFNAEGNGFIYAFNLDGSGIVAGFPIEVQGFTQLNGAALGDINGDGQLDLTALGSNPGFEDEPDLVYINSFNLETVYSPEKILWNTYKGSNTRDGNLDKNFLSSFNNSKIEEVSLDILPNPMEDSGIVRMNLSKSMELTGDLISINGQFIQNLFKNSFQKGEFKFDLSTLNPGIYFLAVKDAENRVTTKKIVVQN